MGDKLVDLDNVLQLIEAEQEVPGPMPPEIWELIRSDKRKAENFFRVLVKKTKLNIITRIKSVYGE